MELLKQLQEDVTATRSSSTNFPLHELFRGASYLSASENTAVVSNVQSPSSRELQQSPPLILGDGVADDELQERESKRSIFGRKERKKYNVRQHEARNDSNTQQQQQQNYGLVSPLSTLKMEENIPTPSTWVMENNNIVRPTPLVIGTTSSNMMSALAASDNNCNVSPTRHLTSSSHEGITTPPRAVGYQRKLSPIAISPITPARIPDYYKRDSYQNNNNSIPKYTLNGNGQHSSTVRLLPNIKNYRTDIEESKSKLS